VRDLANPAGPFVLAFWMDMAGGNYDEENGERAQG